MDKRGTWQFHQRRGPIEGSAAVELEGFGVRGSTAADSWVLDTGHWSTGHSILPVHWPGVHTEILASSWAHTLQASPHRWRLSLSGLWHTKEICVVSFKDNMSVDTGAIKSKVPLKSFNGKGSV